ncbi:MAG: tetratricopeptide repeat protein [Candidatus Riflebacteria bacterium]|nr:tetratricopeptide repeat protein [Candidatus Riflebacteria bacterium]
MKKAYLKAFAATVLLSSLFLSPVQAGHEEESWVLNRQGMYKVAQGDHEAAIKDFEQACRINPFNDTALANLACARNNLGVTLAGQKNFNEAVRQFEAAKAQKPEDISIRLNLLSTLVSSKNAAAVEREARELMNLRPKDPELAMKVAAAFQKTENPGAAIAVLQETSERVQDSANLHAMLGRLLYRNGDLAESEFHLRRSSEINPNDPDNLRFLEKIEREALIEKDLQTFTSIHFSLSCPGSYPADWAEDMLEQLEEACSEVGEQLNFFPSQRSQVLIMQTDDFRRVHDLPDWAGGLYDGRIRLPVPGSTMRPEALRGAVMHEYTHHVIYLLSSGNCPIWLNEGLAQLFEAGYDRLPVLSELVADTSISSLANLDTQFKSNPDRQQAVALYRSALAATAKLVSEYGWRRVAELIANMATGDSFARISLEVLAIDYHELETLCLSQQN